MVSDLRRRYWKARAQVLSENATINGRARLIFKAMQTPPPQRGRGGGGAVFNLIANGGKMDRLLMGGDRLNQRINDVMNERCEQDEQGARHDERRSAPRQQQRQPRMGKQKPRRMRMGARQREAWNRGLN